MAEDSDNPGQLTADEAFAVLGNEIRIQILRTLADADGSATFGTLREAVGVGNPGKFNYHLGKLTDEFIEQTEDGYRLRPSAPG